MGHRDQNMSIRGVELAPPSRHACIEPRRDTIFARAFAADTRGEEENERDLDSRLYSSMRRWFRDARCYALLAIGRDATGMR